MMVECRGGGEGGVKEEANKGLRHVGVDLEGGVLCRVCSPCSRSLPFFMHPYWTESIREPLICSNELTNFSHLAF